MKQPNCLDEANLNRCSVPSRVQSFQCHSLAGVTYELEIFSGSSDTASHLIIGVFNMDDSEAILSSGLQQLLVAMGCPGA
jgi:hypothetical protein